MDGPARLILIDLPGHGKSDKPQTNYTMDYFASAVLAVMRDARVEKATLVGHSMGTPVICRVYAQAPEKVAALVAVDGLLRAAEDEPRASRTIYWSVSHAGISRTRHAVCELHVSESRHGGFARP